LANIALLGDAALADNALPGDGALLANNALPGDGALLANIALPGDGALLANVALPGDDALLAKIALPGDGALLTDIALWGSDALLADVALLDAALLADIALLDAALLAATLLADVALLAHIALLDVHCCCAAGRCAAGATLLRWRHSLVRCSAAPTVRYTRRNALRCDASLSNAKPRYPTCKHQCCGERNSHLCGIISSVSPNAGLGTKFPRARWPIESGRWYDFEAQIGVTAAAYGDRRVRIGVAAVQRRYVRAERGVVMSRPSLFLPF
jgi:hypothetical protein